MSIDTRKSEVMTAALGAGARLVNDVSALTFDPRSAEVVAASGAPVVLMHHQGDPATMQDAPRYDDVLVEIYLWLEERIAAAEAAGIARSNILVDPGFGFGKTVAHNLELMNGLALLHVARLPDRRSAPAASGPSARCRTRRRPTSASAAASPSRSRPPSRASRSSASHDVVETVQALKIWRGLRDQALTPAGLNTTTIGPSGTVTSRRWLAGSHNALTAPSKNKALRHLSWSRKKRANLPNETGVLADDEARPAVGADADAVADVQRSAVMVERRVELAADDQHRARLGGEADVGRGLPLVAGDDLGAAVAADLEHAVGHQMEIAAALAPVDRAHLPPSTMASPIGRPSSSNMPAFIAKATWAGALAELRLEVGEVADRRFAARRGDQLDPPRAGVADGEAVAFELAFLRRPNWSIAARSAEPSPRKRREAGTGRRKSGGACARS